MYANTERPSLYNLPAYLIKSFEQFIWIQD